MKRKRKSYKGLKIACIILLLMLLLASIALYAAARYIYRSSFDHRCTTSWEAAFWMKDFPEMKRERYEFQSDKGQKLVGYLYEKAEESVQAERTADVKAVVVFAHGLGGGGQTGHIDIFSFLTQHGYSVFAYDATGNDESEGKVIGGLPQGIIDLDHAISFVQTIESVKTLPVVLMGYSWGGFSVGNVLNYHPEVKAAVTLAGWNKSMNLIEHQGEEIAGPVSKVLLPFASLYEVVTYGKYAFSTAMRGFRNTDCGIMIVHSEDDKTVPIRYGYDTYIKKYGDSERFVFTKFEDRGHDVYKIAGSMLDVTLFGEIVEFYDSYVK